MLSRVGALGAPQYVSETQHWRCESAKPTRVNSAEDTAVDIQPTAPPPPDEDVSRKTKIRQFRSEEEDEILHASNLRFDEETECALKKEIRNDERGQSTGRGIIVRVGAEVPVNDVG
jgi:hypothetical protein